VTCSYCATELPHGAMFCGECGRAVSSTPEGVPRGNSQPTATVSDIVEPQLEPEPEPTPEPEPEAEAAPEPEPEPQPESMPEPEPERCAQCGAVVGTSDIFCGECGFVRQAASTSSPPPRDTVALDPFPWGAVPAVPASDFEDDVDETRIVDRTAGGERFVLQFSTGESVSVSGTGLVGRNPNPEPGEYFDSLITISDPGKSVSKTHLEFGQDGGAFWVSDRHSGNGTVVREPGAPPRRCDAGKRYRIVRGSRVDIGEQFFVVS